CRLRPRRGAALARGGTAAGGRVHRSAEPEGATMRRFSFRRFLAVLRKEWIQIRRDPFTLRMIVALPVMQLFLFGYAINADPKHLPTGLLSVGNSKYIRTIAAALNNSGYYQLSLLKS